VNEPIDHHFEALEAIEKARLAAEHLSDEQRPMFYAHLASAHASLAAHDAVLNLRNHAEELPARIQRRLAREV
jgi:hypothetical protein